MALPRRPRRGSSDRGMLGPGALARRVKCDARGSGALVEPGRAAAADADGSPGAEHTLALSARAAAEATQWPSEMPQSSWLRGGCAQITDNAAVAFGAVQGRRKGRFVYGMFRAPGPAGHPIPLPHRGCGAAPRAPCPGGVAASARSAGGAGAAVERCKRDHDFGG
ncbi:unnamed protein product, partial [Prorocentrum cordatum]